MTIGHPTFTTGPTVGKRTSTRPPDIKFRSPDPEPDHVIGSSHYLPIDTPVRTSNINAAILRGLSWFANLAGYSPVDRPFTQFQSKNFPLSLPSNAGPAGIGTRIGYSTNKWSPSSHWLARQGRERLTAVPVTPSPFYSTAKGSQRMRGRVVMQPPALPSWLTTTGQRVQ